MKRFGLFCAVVSSSMLLASANAEEIVTGACKTQDYIMVFAKNFDIDGKTQDPVGDPGRFIVLKKGQSYKGWKLDEDRFRWHCGTVQNGKWVGPVGKAIEDYTKVPGVGSLVTGIFGNWERDRSKGAKSIDIEYKQDGEIVFTAR